MDNLRDRISSKPRIGVQNNITTSPDSTHTQATYQNCIELIDTKQAATFLNMKVSRLRNLVFKIQHFFKVSFILINHLAT